jgi:TetR/AcrR family transcriptional regulator, transcriptional repressor for nem operon
VAAGTVPVAVPSRRAYQLAEGQFRAMGREDAKELAVALIAAYEGIALLAATQRDPSLISVEGDRLNRWIDSLNETRTILQ